MTLASAATPKTIEELQNRITILEKFVELKSNECAYYRSKVHLMQIHPLPPEQSTPRRSISFEQSSSSETHATRSNSIDERHRPHVSTKAKPILKAPKISLPFDRTSSRFTSPVRRYRKPIRSSYAQNQNYFDEEPAEGRSTHHANLLEQMLIAYATAKPLPSM